MVEPAACSLIGDHVHHERMRRLIKEPVQPKRAFTYTARADGTLIAASLRIEPADLRAFCLATCGSGELATDEKPLSYLPRGLHERDLISERTRAGLASARARGRKGGRRPKMTPAKLRLAIAAMGKPETNVGDLCRELGVTRSTLYRHVSPTGEAGGNAVRLLKTR